MVVSFINSSLVAACDTEAPAPQKEVGMTLSLSSTALREGAKIPVEYTCEGQDVSPFIAWSEAPQKTQACADS